MYFAVKNALVNAADDRRQIELEKPKKYDNAGDYFKSNPEIIKREQQTLPHIPVTPAPVNNECPAETAKPEEISEPVKAKTIYGSAQVRSVSLHSSHTDYIARTEKPQETYDIPLPEEPPTAPAFTAVSGKVVVAVDDDDIGSICALFLKMAELALAM